jgi:hypothetical protein
LDAAYTSGLVAEVVLPNSKNSPTALPQGGRYESIARLVVGYFGAPVGLLAGGHPAVDGAAVPKAAVNENGEPLPLEEEIRLAYQGTTSTPAGDVLPTQHSQQH